MKLLHVDSSILGAHSISRQLSAEIVAKLRKVTPDLEISYRASRPNQCRICQVPLLPRGSRRLGSRARMRNMILCSAPRFWMNFLRQISWSLERQCTILAFQAS